MSILQWSGSARNCCWSDDYITHTAISLSVGIVGDDWNVRDGVRRDLVTSVEDVVDQRVIGVLVRYEESGLGRAPVRIEAVEEQLLVLGVVHNVHCIVECDQNHLHSRSYRAVTKWPTKIDWLEKKTCGTLAASISPGISGVEHRQSGNLHNSGLHV